MIYFEQIQILIERKIKKRNKQQALPMTKLFRQDMAILDYVGDGFILFVDINNFMKLKHGQKLYD